MSEQHKNIWIIGASDGIGEALAYELAREGHRVAVSARSKGKLNKVVKTMEGAEDHHVACEVDVSDLKSVQRAQDNILKKWEHIDSVIFMAGLYQPMKMGALDLEASKTIIDVNLTGAFYVAETALAHFKARGQGQLVLCASVAGYRGLPNSQPYGATKAAVINMAESLRAELGSVFDIKVINPGFVKTRLTDKNDFEMPFKISPEEAAKAIASDLKTRKFEIHFPKKFTFMMKALQLLPPWVYFKLTGQQNEAKEQIRK